MPRLGLDYTEIDIGGKKSIYKWHIYVRQSSKDGPGSSAVTPTDCTESDIDREIDNLINELNTIRTQIRKKYLSYK